MLWIHFGNINHKCILIVIYETNMPKKKIRLNVKTVKSGAQVEQVRDADRAGALNLALDVAKISHSEI